MNVSRPKWRATSQRSWAIVRVHSSRPSGSTDLELVDKEKVFFCFWRSTNTAFPFPHRASLAREDILLNGHCILYWICSRRNNDSRRDKKGRFQANSGCCESPGALHSIKLHESPFQVVPEWLAGNSGLCVWARFLAKCNFMAPTRCDFSVVLKCFNTDWVIDTWICTIDSYGLKAWAGLKLIFVWSNRQK